MLYPFGLRDSSLNVHIALAKTHRKRRIPLYDYISDLFVLLFLIDYLLFDLFLLLFRLGANLHESSNSSLHIMKLLICIHQPFHCALHNFCLLCNPKASIKKFLVDLLIFFLFFQLLHYFAFGLLNFLDALSDFFYLFFCSHPFLMQVLIDGQKLE